MELRQLEYFLTICRTKNFTKAAKKLYVSQPAITNAINNLENELDIKLFLRTKRMVALTPEGEAFHKYVSHLMNDLEYTLFQMNQLKEVKKRIIKVAINSFLYSWFKPIYHNYQEENQGIEMHLSICENDTCIRLVADEEYSMAIMISDEKNTPEHGCELLIGKFVLYHSLNDDLSRTPQIITMQGNQMIEDKIKEWISQYDHYISVKATCCEIVSDMLLTSNSVALLPNFLSLPSADLFNISDIDSELSVSIHLIWKEEMYPYLKPFVDYIKSFVEDKNELHQCKNICRGKQ